MRASAKFAGAAAGAVIVGGAGVFWRLAEHAMFGWTENQIARLFPFLPQPLLNLLDTTVLYSPFVLVGLPCVAIGYWIGKKWSEHLSAADQGAMKSENHASEQNIVQLDEAGSDVVDIHITRRIRSENKRSTQVVVVIR